jgi:hypothetical protein
LFELFIRDSKIIQISIQGEGDGFLQAIFSGLTTAHVVDPFPCIEISLPKRSNKILKRKLAPGQIFAAFEIGS